MADTLVDSSAIQQSSRTVAVVFEGDTLFNLSQPIGPFTATDRARGIEERLKQLERTADGSRDSLTILNSLQGVNILAHGIVIATVTDSDAFSANISRLELANLWRNKFQTALVNQSFWNRMKTLGIGVFLALLTTALFIIILRVSGRLFPKIYSQLNSWHGNVIRPLRIQSLELIPAIQITNGLISLVKALHVLLVLLLFYFYLPLVFSFFQLTRGLAAVMFGYISTAFSTVLKIFVGYLPNLFFIAMIALVTYYVVKFVKLLFTEIDREVVTLPGFYSDWAMPTFKIVRFMMIAFSVVVAFPYLPGSDSPAFKGVSIFLSVLFSLGSSSAIANIVAGTILTYMRPFKIGDRVKISDTIGDVVERTQLVTRIHTIKHVDVTIPNSMVLGSHIINFSSSAQNHGLILNTTVTIGYDAPWRKIHELLIGAARATDNILSDPTPFVLQTSLDDFFVSYELNAFTKQPNLMANTYSMLHQNIQDKFNEAGVEIMSPHYSALRDGNQTTTPEVKLPKSYSAPGIREFTQSKPNMRRGADEE